MNFRHNPLLQVDSYKLPMFLMYPQNMTGQYSYIESRGGKWDRTCFFGAQACIIDKMTQPFTKEHVKHAAAVAKAHGEPFNEEGFNYILNKHGGHLPISIKAVPEGTVVPTHNVLMDIENTDPNCAWLTSILETKLQRGVWYPTTVSTLSFHGKKIIYDALLKSCVNPKAELPFRLHDFGARSSSSGETAELAGMAHLVHWKGTDTLEAIVAAEYLYDCEMPGFSIPASEHSVICAWGREGEEAAYRNMIQQFGKKGGIFACVSDAYDLWNAVENMWGGSLREDVLASGATVVIRPDSGDPRTVPVKTVEILAEKFGYTVNNKGFKVLNPAVRVIQGDGIDLTSLKDILDNLLSKGFSAENCAFGMGSALHQKVDRDTQKFAMKCSAAEINGEWIDVYKDPITDPGKRSKRGKLALVQDDQGEFQTVPLHGNEDRNLLREVFRDGELKVRQTFDEIRSRADSYFN